MRGGGLKREPYRIGGKLDQATSQEAAAAAHDSSPLHVSNNGRAEYRTAAASGVRERLAGFRTDIEARCSKADLAPDLAQDIGSSRWFRGVATMLGLGLLAISFWPDLTAVEAAA